LLGFIGGSGVYDPSILTELRNNTVDTPFGAVPVQVGRYQRLEVAFLQRHGSGHKLPPHKINYRANMWALWAIGADMVISTSAVGSLNPEMPPGGLVLVDEFIDFTKGRTSTYFDGGEFGLEHVDFTEPYCPELRRILAQAADASNVPYASSGCYFCVDGPRYETPAEIRAFKALGGDVVGMTNVPEVVLARELGLCYQTVCMVTNWGAGTSSERLSHQEVLDVMSQNRESLKSVLTRAMDSVPPQGRLNCACGGPRDRVGDHKR